MKISVVIPVYKADGCLDELYLRLKKALTNITKDYEIILVNDASPDESWEKIQSLNKADKNVKGINFSRNFGQHYAITAGLDYSTGDYVVVMDCDLQDQPEEIRKLYGELKNGYDVVFGRREKRRDSVLKRIHSKVFYLFYNYFTDSSFDSSVANFSISRKIVINNFRLLRERSRSFPLFINWIGFKIGYVKVQHSKRYAGKSSYTFRKLISLAMESIVSQTNKPLKLSVQLGFLLALVALIAAVILVVLRLSTEIKIEGWTSIIVSIFFSTGLILANIGIVGIYLGRVFEESKHRPLYIIRDAVGIKAFKN